MKNKQITSRKKQFHNKDGNENGKKLKASLVVKTNKHQRYKKTNSQLSMLALFFYLITS